jgi:NADH-quinone oxidoreductase subunit N
MAVAVATRSSTAPRALLFYLAAYAVTNLAAFAVVTELPHTRTVASYRGLAARHPGLAAVLVEPARPGRHPAHCRTPRQAASVHRPHRRRLRLAGRAGRRQHRREPVLLPALAGARLPALARRGQRGGWLGPAGRWAAVVAYAAGAASLAVGIAGAATLPLVSGHLIAA